MCQYCKLPNKTIQQERTHIQQWGSGLLFSCAIHVIWCSCAIHAMMFPNGTGTESQNPVHWILKLKLREYKN